MGLMIFIKDCQAAIIYVPYRLSIGYFYIEIYKVSVIRKNKKGELIVYTLPSDMTIYKIDNVKKELVNFLERQMKAKNKEINIDASAVVDLDTAGLQLLLALHLTCKQLGVLLQITKKSQFFEQIMNLTGAFNFIEEAGD